jgi:hypothetical protein
MMNERIRELAEQVYGSAHYDDFKFAELIVRECSKVIRHGGQRKGAFGNEDLRPSEIATMIEEHFGVEE